jgi:hypothetical protein
MNGYDKRMMPKYQTFVVIATAAIVAAQGGDVNPQAKRGAA